MNGYYKLVIAMLKQHGFFLARQPGTSHQTWSNGKVSVTVSTNCASRHTANRIMKDAGIKHHF